MPNIPHVTSVAILITVFSVLILGEEFSYTGQHGAEYWGGMCKTGKQQSPIDLDSGETLLSHYENLILLNYDNPTAVNVTYNGHTVRLDVEQPCTLTAVAGGLPGVYVLDHIHFHWPSEHTINGISLPLEAHFVHFNSKHKSLREAVKYENGIAVLGVLFHKTEKDNMDLESFMKVITSITNIKSSTMPSEKITPGKIVPDDISRFYRYEGSLTTPGCDETVLWTVFPMSEGVSQKQLNRFQSLKTPSGKTLTFNNRKTQPLNGRTVRERGETEMNRGSSTTRFSYISIILSLALANRF